jgi:predicted nucleotidyltransferase
MLYDIIEKLPDRYRDDVIRAVEILISAGCKDIYLFGSLASGEENENSDIDIAISGCPTGKFFSILGMLFMKLDHPVDLVDLDKEDDFAKYLLNEGDLLHVS